MLKRFDVNIGKMYQGMGINDTYIDYIEFGQQTALDWEDSRIFVY